MPEDRRQRIATWTTAVIESSKDEQIAMSDIQLTLGSLAGLAVWDEETPDGIAKQELRDHARNLMIGAFERGCDRISTLDLSDRKNP